MPYSITLGRVQDAIHEAAPGHARILTDRLWPRGLRKAALGDIEWYKGASPATELRKGYHDGSLSPAQFQTQYAHQLQADEPALLPLMRLARQGRLQLLTATRDPQNSYLVVLKQAVLDALHTEDQACQEEPSSPACYAHLSPKQLR